MNGYENRAILEHSGPVSSSGRVQEKYMIPQVPLEGFGSLVGLGYQDVVSLKWNKIDTINILPRYYNNDMFPF